MGWVAQCCLFVLLVFVVLRLLNLLLLLGILRTFNQSITRSTIEDDTAVDWLEDL